MSRLTRLTVFGAGPLLVAAMLVGARPAAADGWGKVDCSKNPSDPGV